MLVGVLLGHPKLYQTLKLRIARFGRLPYDMTLGSNMIGGEGGGG